jgi:DNA-directed RNA polymerase I, II, and III subunit RPABC1
MTTYQIEQAKKHLNEMLMDRGYHFNESEKIYMKNDDKLKYFICIHMKVNIDIVKQYIQELEQLEIYHCIIIYNQMITSSTKKIFEHMIKFTFEIFHLDELQYNITKHVLYFPHSKLSNEEIKKIKSNILKHLPIIFKSDPVCRYFSFEKGDVIKIIRANQTIIYRIVR